MRSLDDIYWDAECDDVCGCQSLKQALATHPELTRKRDGVIADEPPVSAGPAPTAQQGEL